MKKRCEWCQERHLEGELLDVVHSHLVRGSDSAGREDWKAAYKEILEAVAALTDYILELQKDLEE